MVDKPYGNMELPSFSEHEPHADLLVLISPSIRLSLNTSMLNFSQFLHEVFFKGTKGAYGYTEIYKNPGGDDLKACGGTSSSHQIGAIISGKNLYVWDRDAAEHHQVKDVIPRAGKTWIPLYLYYDAHDKSIKISVSSFSMYSLGLHDYSENEIITTCQKHPAFSWFSKVSARY